MKFIAHRSGPTVYPEQTIASGLLALRNGADFVEVDTWFTADGTVVISHDPHTARFDGSTTRICDMTTAQFLALRHAAAPQYPTHTLQHFITAGVLPLLLHIKDGGEKLSALLQLITDNACGDQVVFGVESVQDARAVKAWNADWRVLGFMPNTDKIAEFAAAGCDFIRLWEQWLTPENIAAVNATGKKLWIMACDNENGVDARVGYTQKENLPKWQALGVDAVLLDDITVRHSL